MKIKEVHKIVVEVLEQHPATRDNDGLLYAVVCKRLAPDCVNRPFFEVIAKRGAFGLPAFESVSRARRKAQEMHPELAAVAEVELAREENEQAFKQYALFGGA